MASCPAFNQQMYAEWVKPVLPIAEEILNQNL